MTAPSDEQLYASSRKGDVAAFDQLYVRYERRLFGFVLRLLGDRAAAEEVFHDALLEVIDGPALKFEQARFQAWLFRVARNACANRLRSKARGGAAFLRIAGDDESAPSPEERVVEAERSTLLAAAVQRLPQALAELFHLRASGLSYDEIASVLDVPPGTVKSRLHTLVQELKGEMT